MKTKTRFFIFFTFLFLSYHNGFAQHSLKLGTGFGISSGVNTEGAGWLISVGYQRDIWNEKARLNPFLSIGTYTSKLVLDSRDNYFNSINLGATLFLDPIKFKTSSVVLGLNVFGNNSIGLKGFGGLTDPDSPPQTSEFVDDYYYGGGLSLGYRWEGKNERTAMQILPFNFYLGNREFSEFNLMLELEFKL